ncbi:MAG: alpha/beta fold hydrolase [Candidatus Aenigmarchaeota archaeon]|nr:alpha/beta fold hydrolase [Candidatus Aenigmarchaeota archaeon]
MSDKIHFTNTKGDKLCGVLSNPTNAKGSPIIIICHGFSSNKESGKYAELERLLNYRKIATFRFDLYGHGESEGDFADITVAEAVDDIMNAIKHIKNLGYTKIGLFGSSFGGMASLLAASQTNELYILVLNSPVSNYSEGLFSKYSEQYINEWKKDGYRMHEKSDGTKIKLNYNFYEESQQHDGYEAAKKISVPTLIIHGDQDETVPIEQSKKTSKNIRNCKLEIIQGANHRYTNPEHSKKLLQLVVDFIVSHS